MTISSRPGERSNDWQSPMTSEQAADPETWVDRYGDCLYRYAILRLRAPDLAADVVQETFLEALKSRHSFAGRSTEQTWLVGILRHKIIDHLRKSGRSASISTSAMAFDDGSGGQPFDARGHWKAGPSSWRGDPTREIESREFWDVFGQCLSRLPQGLADAFFLRELDGMDADEVQRTLQITPANFWKRLHRARMLLRQCLETGWFGRNPSDHPTPQPGTPRP